MDDILSNEALKSSGRLKQEVNNEQVQFCSSFNILLDPFMGSGTTALACIKTNRKYIGIELNKEYVDLAEERIKPLIK